MSTPAGWEPTNIGYKRTRAGARADVWLSPRMDGRAYNWSVDDGALVASGTRALMADAVAEADAALNAYVPPA